MQTRVGDYDYQHTIFKRRPFALSARSAEGAAARAALPQGVGPASGPSSEMETLNDWRGYAVTLTRNRCVFKLRHRHGSNQSECRHAGRTCDVTGGTEHRDVLRAES